jgi:predicted Zn-dependent protease
MEREGIAWIADYDRRFLGTEPLYNWVQDLDMELYNAGIDDPQFFRERIRISEAVLSHLRQSDQDLRPVFRISVAESHLKLGENQIADALFRDLVQDDPQDCNAWIAWANGYRPTEKDDSNARRAEAILKEALAVPDVTERDQLLANLLSLYEETEREEEARAIRGELTKRTQAERLTASRTVGRNDPCPCGSSKK